MFYSHQLLARKAPLGQIWMAATLHAKIHRRKLDKLNIIKICEEILNPSVPMALRLSGILMGGVVIVYERKVKLLYDDVTRLLLEINEAWKIKAAPSDANRLPKRKSQAKYEAVTLPPNVNEDLEDIEESLLHYSGATTFVDFQQTSYLSMRLDNVEDPYLNENQGDSNQDQHQADAANITLDDNYGSHQADTTIFNRFERFGNEGDEETQLNFTPVGHNEIPSLIPSPPRQEELHKPDVIQERHPEELVKQQSDKSKEANPDKMNRRLGRKRARRPPGFAMDYDQTMIPGQKYQSWLQDSSGLLSGRGKKRKLPMGSFSKMKIGTLMNLPSVVLVEKLFTNGHRQVHYPAPLLEVWLRSIQSPHNSSSDQASHPRPPKPSSSSPPERMHLVEPIGDPFDEFDNRVDSLSKGISPEKQRANANNNVLPPEILMEELRNNLKKNGFGVEEANSVGASSHNLMGTPGKSGDEIRSISRSGSGHGFSHNSEVNSGRSGKKRPFSASMNSGNGLEPVAEECSFEHPDSTSKLPKLAKNELKPDHELLVETGPTQTQKHPPVTNQPLDRITDSIRMHLKTHFDTPGSAKVESLNQLASGMNKRRAACLFTRLVYLLHATT